MEKWVISLKKHPGAKPGVASIAPSGRPRGRKSVVKSSFYQSSNLEGHRRGVFEHPRTKTKNSKVRPYRQ